MHQGYGAANSLAEALAQALAGQSGLEYAGQASRNKQTGSLLNSITEVLASL